MYLLGIESSCDETSAAVVSMGDGERRVLSNIVASQIETQTIIATTHIITLINLFISIYYFIFT